MISSASRSMSHAEATTIVRWHALAAASWGVIAALCAVFAIGSLALQIDPPAAVLGVGRIAAAYRHVMLLGSITTALSGGLLRIALPPASPLAIRRRAMIALVVWNAGVALGLVAILFGGMAPDGWLPAPLVARLVLWLAAGLWLWLLWGVAASRQGPLPVAMWFGVSALAGLAVYLSVSILSGVLGGSGQGLSAALAGRGLLLCWAAMAGFAIAAAALPAAAGAPLFGRKAVLAGFLGWMFLAPLAAAGDSVPDLLSPWLVPIVVSAQWLMMVPASFLVVALLGSFVGARKWGLDATTGFLGAGVIATSAYALAASGGATELGSAVRFTAWDPSVSLIAWWPGLLLFSVGACYLSVSSSEYESMPVAARHHLLLVVATTVLMVAPVWPLGLAEAGSGAEHWMAGGAGELLATGFRLRLPGAVLFLISAAVWLANVVSCSQTEPAAADEAPTADGSAGALSVSALGGIAAIAFAIGLIVTLFMPLADPATVKFTSQSLARDFDELGLRGRGRAVYVAQGCLTCHTQRVRRITLDEAYGPATYRGDYGRGPALAGDRRLGPDLTWIGSRYPVRSELANRLQVHAPGGGPSFSWLFDAAGPTPEGELLIDYLVGLKGDGGDS